MVSDNYTDMEDFAVNKEAIEFNNRNDDDQEIGNNTNQDNDNDDNNDDNVLYSKVGTSKRRNKGKRLELMMSKKRKSKGMAKHNRKSWHDNNTSVNHDFVVCGKGDADVEGDADGKDSDNNVDLFEGTKKLRQKIG
jgi:hypothetical protein